MQNDKKTRPYLDPEHVSQVEIAPEHVGQIQNIILDMIGELLNHPAGRLRAALKKEYADERQFHEAIRDAIRAIREESDRCGGRNRSRSRKTNTNRPKFKATGAGSRSSEK